MWSNVVLFSYAFIWLICFIRQRRLTNEVGPSVFVMASYFCYAVISILYYNIMGINYELTLFPYIYLFSMLYLALRPGIEYEKSDVCHIQKPRHIIIYLFIVMYGVCTIVTLPSTLNNIGNGLLTLFSSGSGGLSLYESARNLTVASDNSISGIFGLATIFQNCFRDFSIFILFYYLSLKEKKKPLVIYLVFVLVIDIIKSVANGGRTSFMMIIFSVAVAYFMFHNFWSERYRKYMKRIMIALLIVVSVPFFVLTFSRFGRGLDTERALNSMISYAGMANVNFGQYVLDANGIRYGDRTINELKRLLGFNVPNSIMGVREKYSDMTINDGLFYTFVGDFVLDFGPVIAFGIFLIFSLIFTRYTRSNEHTIPIHRLLLIYFSLCICSQGGMYLYYYSFKMFYVVVAFFIMYLVFYFDYESLKKNDCLTYLSKCSTSQNLDIIKVIKNIIRKVIIKKTGERKL